MYYLLWWVLLCRVHKSHFFQGWKIDLTVWKFEVAE